MAIASIILGIVFIAGGIFCMTAPVDTFMTIMSLFAAMMFVYGIFGIIRFFKRQSLVPEFIVSILAVIVGFVYLFRPGNNVEPGTMAGLDRIVLFMVAAWFLVKGCVSVYYSVRTRFFNDHWIYGFVTGLLSAVLGIFSFIYPNVAASSVGILVGLWFIQCGVDFIVFGMTAKYIENVVEETRKSINRTMNEVRNAAAEYSRQLNGDVTESTQNSDDKSEKSE